MALSIPRFLFLSLLFHSILLAKCDDEEESLVREINQYRASLNLRPLTKNNEAECLASEVVDRFQNQPCTNASGPNTTPPQFSNYTDLLTKCRLNANTTGQILPACVPNLVPGLVLSNYTKSQYTRYLNDTQFSGIGIGSEDDWIVVVLTTSTPKGPGSDKEDILLQEINQYRTSLNLTTLTENDGAECLASEVADRFQDLPCTNTSGPNTTPPPFSNYTDLLTKCRLNANITGQILPVCVPHLVPGLVLSNYTNSQYTRYLNDTQFSGIGIGSEDDWIVVVLTASTSNGTFSPGSGSSSPGTGSNPANGASSLIAISPVVFSLISIFVLV